jgi:hypothetical protein
MGMGMKRCGWLWPLWKVDEKTHREQRHGEEARMTVRELPRRCCSRSECRAHLGQ